MLLKKAALLLVSLLLVAAANLRLVYSVSVDGAPLEGSWSRQSVENAYDAAMAAAEEVARGGAVPPELETEARLSILPARGEVSELAEAILCSAGGVEMAWAVSVDGVELGCVGDISALSEQLESVIGSQIPHSAVSAGFDANIAIRPLAIPEGTQSDLTELSGGHTRPGSGLLRHARRGPALRLTRPEQEAEPAPHSPPRIWLRCEILSLTVSMETSSPPR